MSRLLHLLALLAMMLMPMAMHGASAAPTPHHGAAEAGHCDGSGQRQGEEEKGRSADCAIACSAVACGSQLSEPLATPRAAYLAAPSPFFAGTAPGSDPPPPRLS